MMMLLLMMMMMISLINVCGASIIFTKHSYHIKTTSMFTYGPPGHISGSDLPGVPGASAHTGHMLHK